MLCFEKFGGKSGADYAFKKIWGFISKLDLADFMLPTNHKWIYQSFQLNKMEYLLLELIDLLTDRGIDYSPPIKIQDNELLLKIISSNKPGIIVSVHTGFAFNLKWISDYGRNTSTISSNHHITKILRRSGIKAPVNIIKNDRYSLAFLKDSILSGSVACCAVDYKADSDTFEYVSPALFKLSKILNIPLYYSKTRVISDGSLLISLKPSSPDLTPIESAHAFIDFINSSPEQQRRLSVKAI